MVKFVEMDEKVTFSKQLEEDVGPVILINKFNVSPEDVDQFLKLWAAPAAIAKNQPGFISAQLYRGTAGSCVFVAYVVFESAELLKQALTILTSCPNYRIILRAPCHLLTSSSKWQFQASVWIEESLF